MPSFSDLLKSAVSPSTGKSADAIATTLERLTRQHAEAEAAALAAGAAYNNACADRAISEGTVDGATVDALRKSKESADTAVSHLATALATLRARHSSAIEAGRRDAKRAQWASAAKLNDARLEAARRVIKSAATFAADYQALAALNDQLTAALPVNPEPDGALTRPALIEAAVRRELVRLGLAWAAKLVQPACDIEPFAPQIEAASAMVKRWADEA